jgi:tellurite methyltransferase
MSRNQVPPDESERWLAYYKATEGRPPRPTLLDAMARFPVTATPRLAVDLGCGDGRDTIELLRRGWRVLAIDAEKRALDRLLQRPDLPSPALLETSCARFEDAVWSDCDLVNASFSLPFCPPARFAALWEGIVRSLRPGGRFAGQLFGEHDDWAGDPGMTSLTRREAEALLAGCTVEHFVEEDADGQTATGKKKHWHIFHIVARCD